MTKDIEGRFDRIVRAHGPALRRLSVTYGRSPADADDLFQEICFAIWRALPSFREECSERTFAFRIGHNRGLTFRARQRRHEPIEDSIPDRRPGPDTLTTRAIARDRLVAAVRLLPEGQRQVVSLSLEGLNHADIGEVLGITENNVAVRLNRARQRLRDLLVNAGGSE
jgi:RNA polymerase sigma-70 factor (ECF subfamily)